MDHLQTDIDSLESEKGQLKEKLKSIGGKKSGVTSTPNSDINSSLINDSGNHSLPPPGTPMNESEMYEKIQSLRAALLEESRQKRNLLSQSLQQKLSSMPPLPKFDEKPEQDPKIKELAQKRTELVRVCTFNLLYDIFIFNRVI